MIVWSSASILNCMQHSVQGLGLKEGACLSAKAETNLTSLSAGLEPLNWPSTLDVTLRIDIKYVLQNVSINQGVLGSLSAVRPLLLAPESQTTECQTRYCTLQILHL